MLKNLLQKVFNFGQQDKEVKAGPPNEISQKKRETLSECCSLLRVAQKQRIEKFNSQALTTLERIIEMMEQEGL